MVVLVILLVVVVTNDRLWQVAIISTHSKGNTEDGDAGVGVGVEVEVTDRFDEEGEPQSTRTRDAWEPVI